METPLYADLALLGAATKLERDRAQQRLERRLQLTADDDELADAAPPPDEARQCVLRWALEQLETLQQQPAAAWEARFGALTAATLALQPCADEAAPEDAPCGAGAQLAQLAALLPCYLDDAEYRVRVAAGLCLGSLSRRDGLAGYMQLRATIFQHVAANLERRPVPDAEQHPVQLHEKLGASQEDVFHESAGWKALETWMACLEAVVRGAGARFGPLVDEPLLSLVCASLRHRNRFVRETGFQVLAQVGEACAGGAWDARLAAELGRGMADNWSQVRMAASVATRRLLLALSTAQRKPLWAALLPALCLNRYYVAEGVRLYCQETWRLVAGEAGRTLVEAHLGAVVDFYVTQSAADNHAVREAACACIAELGHKLAPDAVAPYAPQLLAAVAHCFQDDSWPVRDAACLACGHFLRSFPDTGREQLARLLPLFYDNLADNIPSVRQGAAAALANVVQAYEPPVQDTVLEHAAACLSKAADQPADDDAHAQPAPSSSAAQAQFGVVDARHTDQPMFSCGSLAPKMGRGGGCMDHGFRRPAQPWEAADGALHLLAELAPHAPAPVAALLPAAAAACSLTHFRARWQLLESAARVMPALCRGLGKPLFKRHLEALLPVLAEAALATDEESRLTALAGQEALAQLARLLGPSIVRGRLEQLDEALLHRLAPFLPS